MPRDSAAAERVAVQREREIDYLQNRRDRERAYLQGPSSTETLWSRVEEIINNPKLDRLLEEMAKHNASGEAARHWREEAVRRRLAEVTVEGLEEESHRERAREHEHEHEPKPKLLQPLLLTPTLRQLLVADAGRKQALSAYPDLAGQPAEIRNDLDEAARLAADLATLLDRLPQPHVALAAMEPNEVLAHTLFFGTAPIEGGSTGTRLVPASQLLLDLGGALKAMQVAATGQRLHGTREAAELQRYAVRKLTKLFVDQLEEPRDADVAALVKLLFNIQTDVEAVKKMRQRQRVTP